jgi:hypothetical protein
MGMENKHIGYVYLVDWNARIRWAACGYAAEGQAVQATESGSEDPPPSTTESGMQGEVHGLLRCTDVLLGRCKKLYGDSSVSP